MFGPDVPTIDAAAVPADALILDVREDDEWQAGRIHGALHLPLMSLPQRLPELSAILDGRTVHVVCRVGGRSAQATAFLIDQGVEAFNIEGGMFAWAACGRAMVSDGTDPYVL